MAVKWILPIEKKINHKEQGVRFAKAQFKKSLWVHKLFSISFKKNQYLMKNEYFSWHLMNNQFIIVICEFNWKKNVFKTDHIRINQLSYYFSIYAENMFSC